MNKILIVLLVGMMFAAPTYSQNPFKNLLTLPKIGSQNNSAKASNRQNNSKSSPTKKDYSFLDINKLEAEALTPVELDKDDPNRWICGKTDEIAGFQYNANSNYEPPFRYPDLKFSTALYEAAMNGDPVAQDKLGFCYKYGSKVNSEASYEKAKLFFEESYKNGFMEASLHYAASGYGTDLVMDAVNKNYAPACMFMYYETLDIEYIVKAARLGYTEGFCKLGQYAYELGKYEEAVALLKKALDQLNEADPNNPRPLITNYRNSKEMYLKSLFRVLCKSEDPKDIENAFIIARYSFNVGASKEFKIKLPEFESVNLVDLYNKFAQANNTTPTLNTIMRCMLLPLKDEMEQYQTRKSIEAMAAQNDKYVLFEAGTCYRYGIGMPEGDTKKAAAYYKSAHEQGLKFILDIPSLFYRSSMYYGEPSRYSTTEEYYNYLVECCPLAAKKYQVGLDKKLKDEAQMREDSKKLLGKWKYVNQSTKDVFEFTFLPDNKATVRRTSSKSHEVRDQLYRFNNVVYHVDYTMKHVCNCQYWVKDGKLHFTNVPFEMESFKITKPANPNHYVTTYMYENAPAMNVPLISLFSDLPIVVNGKTLEITWSNGNKETWQKIQE